MTFFVYAHCRPDMTPFYIGKGDRRRANNLTRNAWHRKVVSKYGKENIIVELFACASEKEAFFREKLTISALRRSGVVLCNMTDGGEGASGHVHSEETKAIISATHKGKLVSEETRAKMSEALKGKPLKDDHRAKCVLINIGRKHSDETRAKLSEAAKGRKLSKDHIEKIRAAHIGVKRSEETKAKISEANRKRKHSQETKDKIGSARKGKLHSLEARVKMSKPGLKNKVIIAQLRQEHANA